MSKGLTAQKNFLFNGRVLGVGERFSTSVLHARDLIAGKLAVEAVEEGKSNTKSASAATAPDNPTVAGGSSALRPVVESTQAASASSDDISGKSTAADESDTEDSASGDTQDASTETSSSTDDSTPSGENYDQMTMGQLKDVLNEIGVPFAARASKADLLELVKESFGEDIDVAANQNSSSN